MAVEDFTDVPVETQLEAVSEAIQRAEADSLSAQVALDRERADFTIRGAKPSRALLVAATRVVDDLRRTDEALAALLRELGPRPTSG